MKVLDLLQPSSDFRVSDCSVQTLAFGPSGLMATGDVRRKLRVWRDQTEIMDADLRSHREKIRPTERIRGIKFSPDGKHLYAACGDVVQAIDVLSRQTLWQYRPPRAFGFLIVSPLCLAVSTTGNVAASTDGGSLSVWDGDGMLLSSWRDNEAPRQCFFGRDESLLLGTDSFNVCKWQLRSGRKILHREYPERAFGMAYSPLTDRLAVRSFAHVDIMDGESFETLLRLPAGEGLPVVGFSQTDGALLIADSRGIDVYDSELRSIARLGCSASRVISASFTNQNRQVVAGCFDGCLRLWDVK